MSVSIETFWQRCGIKGISNSLMLDEQFPKDKIHLVQSENEDFQH